MDRFAEKVFSVSLWDKQVEKFVKVLNCKTRRDILKIIVQGHCSIWSIAEELNLPLSTVSEHVKELIKSGLISVIRQTSDRGHSKIVALQYEKIEFYISNDEPRYRKSNYSVNIPIGSYSSFKIRQLCGMAGADCCIGARDNPDSFYNPYRATAQLLWFDCGYLEYVVPIEENERKNVESLTLSVEVCSEAPGYNETWPSDIFFEINGVQLCTYTSPGDFGARHGLLTPDWWEGTQYGLMKKIEVNKSGCLLDGMHVSDVTLSQLKLEERSTVTFRIGVKEDAINRGGINIFGKKFGDFPQHIILTLSHSDKVQ
ncbi:MAG: winged helix-turn-helix transcriptional regulator [Clostridia bacterium]|nr:winged helix-turn-helix transcriptional regulator [Clostridia bacterium]